MRYGNAENLAPRRLSQEKKPMRIVRHKKRGTTYEVVGTALLQVSKPDMHIQIKTAGVIVDNARPAIFAYEGQELAVYRSTENGKLYVRQVTEFEDGRFEDIQ